MGVHSTVQKHVFLDHILDQVLMEKMTLNEYC